MTENEIKRVLQHITYKPGYKLKWSPVGTGIYSVWWEYERPDAFTEEMGTGVSGSILIKWSGPHATEEAIVRQVFGMTMRLEEHETREFFMYSDQRPFDPHVKLIEELLWKEMV